MTGQRFKTICANNAVAVIWARESLARHGRPGIEKLREGESGGGVAAAVGKCTPPTATGCAASGSGATTRSS